jgi:uncharacterized protein (TIGR02147 family)
MSPTAPATVSVFHFLDAREFLRRAYDVEKRRNPALSHRYIARTMAAGSSSFFKDVLNGRARLSPPRVAKFAKIFRLTRPETEYFENLVLYTQAESEDEKERCLRRLTQGSPARRHALLEAFQLEYVKKWHYAAVREYLALEAFKGDYEALAAGLRPAITPAEAKEAVQLLLKLGLVRKNAQGGIEKVDDVVTTGPSADRESLKSGIRANLELALRALDDVSSDLRPFSYLTLSVSEESFDFIREKLRAVRREILDVVTRDTAVDRLYQLNFQLFPISKTVKRRKP